MYNHRTRIAALSFCLLVITLVHIPPLSAQTSTPEPPLVELHGFPAKTDQEEIIVELRLTPRSGGVGSVEVYLNGILYAVEGSRGLQIRPLDGVVQVRSLRVDLPRGTNEVRVVAFDRTKTTSVAASAFIVSTFRDWDLVEEYPPAYASMGEAALLEASLRTPSPSERTRLRAYLARIYPDTAEGLFSKASLSKDPQESIELLEAAIARNPGFPVAHNNLVAAYEELDRTTDAIRASERLLDTVPDFDDYVFIRIQYFWLRESSGAEAANSFRAGWESRIGSTHPVFSEIEARKFKDSGDYASAEKSLLRAVSGGRAALRIHTELLNLRLDRLRASAPERDRIEAIRDYLQSVLGMPDPKSRHTGLMTASRRFFDDFKDRFQAVQLALAAYQAYPGAEALQTALDRGGSYWHDEIGRILEKAEPVLTGSTIYALTMADSFDIHRDDPERAETWLIRAVRWAHTPADRNRAIGYLGTLYESRLAQPDKAKKLYMANASFRNDKKALYMNLHHNRIEAMDFEEARAYLELYAPYTDTSGSWFQNRVNLTSALSLVREEPGESVIVLSSLLHSLHMAVAPDARTVAAGDTPISVWDVDRGVKIRDLGRGGSERRYSRDGKLLATIAEHDGAHVLYVYEAASGRTLLAWPSHLELVSLCFNPDGTRVALCDAAGLVHVFDPRGGRKVSTFQMGGLRISGPMVWTAANLLVCGQAQSNQLTVRDGEDYRLIRTLTGVNWPHALGSTFDGRYVLCGDNRRTLTVWDTRTWESRSVQTPTGSKRITPHPTKPIVLLDNFTGAAGGRDIGLTLFDAESMQFLGDCEGGNRMDAGFSPDGSRILTERALSVEIRDSRLVLQKEVKTPFAPLTGALLDRKNGYLVFRTGGRTQFMDVTTGERVRSEKEAWPFLWDEAGGILLRTMDAGPNREVWLLDTSTFRSRKVISTSSRFDVHTIGDRYVVLSSVEGSDRDARGRCDNPTGKGELEIWDKKTFTRVAGFSFPLCTESVRLGLYNPDIQDVSVDERSGIVAVATSWQDGWGTARVSSRNVQRFGFKGESYPPLRFPEETKSLRYLPDGTLEVGFSGRFAAYRGTERVTDFASSHLRRIPLRGGESIRWNDSVAEVRGIRRIFPGNLEGLLVDQDRNLLIAVLLQNEFRFFDLETFQLRCSLAVKDDRDWIAFTPSGEYSASEHGSEFAFWNDHGSLIPFERVRTLKNDPRVLARALAAVRERSREKVLSSLELPFPVELLDHLVTLETDLPLESRTAAESFALSLRVLRKSYDSCENTYLVPVLELYQNGRRVPDRYFPQPSFTAPETRFSVSIPLAAGLNSFEIRATYRGIELGRKNLSVFRDRGESSPGSLYFLGIGVGTYANSRQNLEYARADVEALRDVLVGLKGSPYSRINSRLLLDSEAKSPAVEAAFRDFLSHAREEDLVVIYLSGHGARNDRRELCLLTHESDFSDPRTWYGLSALRDYLVNRPLLQRAVVVMDICHAGSGIPAGALGQRRDATSEQAAWDMTRETGTLYLAAALGSQRAFEGESFGGGHGAFTAALLEGLSGKAGTKEGIGSHELARYVIDRVITLTGGNQIPLSNYASTLDYKISQPGGASDAPAR